MKIDWKKRFKITLKARLIIIGSIFATVGWFLVVVLLFGRFFAEELLEIERLVESPAFVWSFRAVIIAFTAVLVWQYKWLDRTWQKPAFRNTLYFFWAVGLMGWIMGVVDLIM